MDDRRCPANHIENSGQNAIRGIFLHEPNRRLLIGSQGDRDNVREVFGGTKNHILLVSEGEFAMQGMEIHSAL